jgi:hypothetical protein
MTTLRKQLIARVADLGVEDVPLAGRSDGFSSLFYRGKDFAHFHNDNELDLRLSKAVIRREGLTHPAQSTRHPKRSKTSNWIELPFHSPADLEQIVRLIGLAIQELT